MIADDRLMEPFLTETGMFAHGLTFGGHPVSCAVALANLEILAREDLLGHVRANEATFRATVERLHDLPIVGDVRGDGYFYGIELVKDKATRETFDDTESERLLHAFLSPALFASGLYCRADDRGDPVVQLAPPLTAGRSSSTRWSGSCGLSSLRRGPGCSPTGGRVSGWGESPGGDRGARWTGSR